MAKTNMIQVKIEPHIDEELRKKATRLGFPSVQSYLVFMGLHGTATISAAEK